MRDGVAPSRVYLPPGPWATVLEFLLQRFLYMPPEVLRDRLAQGQIVDDLGVAQGLDSEYRPERWLWYYRESPAETLMPFDLPILYKDDRLVVVDKPHFLASIPGGRYVRQTALTRLRHLLDEPLLSPIHRLDRDTAGVMLFCLQPGSRGAYQALFQTREVLKEYEAVGRLRGDLSLPLVYRSRLERSCDHFIMREVAGEPNSETHIELVSRLRRDGMDLGHYRLRPHTGRKHQLRIHLSALGIPILNDAFYPVVQPPDAEDDVSRPMQLLARAVEFVDPFSGRLRRFESRRRLDALEAESP